MCTFVHSYLNWNLQQETKVTKRAEFQARNPALIYIGRKLLADSNNFFYYSAIRRILRYRLSFTNRYFSPMPTVWTSVAPILGIDCPQQETSMHKMSASDRAIGIDAGNRWIVIDLSDRRNTSFSRYLPLVSLIFTEIERQYQKSEPTWYRECSIAILVVSHSSNLNYS